MHKFFLKPFTVRQLGECLDDFNFKSVYSVFKVLTMLTAVINQKNEK